MTEPLLPMASPPPPEPPRPSGERRSAARPRHHVLRDLLFKSLRLVGDRASSFYATVGIVLVAGVVLAIVAIIGFAALGEWVKEGATQAADVAVLEWMKAHHTPTLSRLAVELTYLGTGTVVLMIVGVATLFLWHTEHKVSARFLLAAVAGSILLNNVLKLVFRRERPSVFDWGTDAVSLSFPSGHAMSATVCYGTVAYLVIRLQKHRISRVLTAFGATLLILTICTTRLYLGVHYPTDVVGGIICGIAWSAFCMALLEATIVLGRRRAPHVMVKEEAPAPKEVAATSA